MIVVLVAKGGNMTIIKKKKTPEGIRGREPAQSCKRDKIFFLHPA